MIENHKQNWICRKCGQTSEDKPLQDHGYITMSVYPNEGKIVKCDGEWEKITEIERIKLEGQNPSSYSSEGKL